MRSRAWCMGLTSLGTVRQHSGVLEFPIKNHKNAFQWNVVDKTVSCAAALGYPSVRREQRDAVRAVASGNDVSSALPIDKVSKISLLRYVTVDKLLSGSSDTSIVICVSP